MRRAIPLSAVFSVIFSLCLYAADAPAGRALPSASVHPAIGNWYGKAVQLCPEPLSSCAKVALTMTPSLMLDGTFIGNDTLALAGAPFGPHTTAHGNWIAVSPTKIEADYVFMLIPFPEGNFPSTGVARFRWQAEVIDENTMVGYVNFWPQPPVPTTWESLGENDWPTLPAEAKACAAPPKTFMRDPKTCIFNANCPLIFKFKIQRTLSPGN
jgi:hypothetical protein